ncbi:MAG: ferredoxin [Desulfuromonadaceae bacterium]|nr:ferredoxin [Desulfuromonadaceae bacterium]MDD2849560.1 ferredoxin [Desulfuromonadaceae bacterium]MDD4131986.1 ferredoxin [Desulfuromonadaceae bacterium]
MKVATVETENCISCGLCISLCPTVFRFDDTARSECFDPAGATEAEIQATIDGCPVQCISWM